MDAVPEMCFTFALLPFCELQLQTGAKCFFLPKSFLYWIAWSDIDNTNNVDRYCVKVNGNATRDIYCWQYIEENLSWLNFDRNSRNIYLLPYLKIAQYHENGNWYHGVATIGPSHYIHTIIFIAHIGENFIIYMMKMEISIMAGLGLDGLCGIPALPSHYTQHSELYLFLCALIQWGKGVKRFFSKN